MGWVSLGLLASSGYGELVVLRSSSGIVGQLLDTGSLFFPFPFLSFLVYWKFFPPIFFLVCLVLLVVFSPSVLLYFLVHSSPFFLFTVVLGDAPSDYGGERKQGRRQTR